MFGVAPATPGVNSFIDAIRTLAADLGPAGGRAATDLMAKSATQIGLDHWKGFLRESDDYLTQHGTVIQARAPAPLVGADAAQAGPGALSKLAAVLGRALATFYAASLLDHATRDAAASQAQDAIKRFGLDPASPADQKAALAFVWAQYHGPALFGTPFAGPKMEAMAERVMRAVRADPALLDRALMQDTTPLKSAVEAAEWGTLVETRTEEEAALVADLRRAGKNGAEIQAALDDLRKTGSQTAQGTDAAPARTERFPSSDPLVANLAAKLDAAFPGRVIAVNVNIRRPDGTIATDVDIQLKDAAIQVKSGNGNKLTRQIVVTQHLTGQRTIAYSPNLGPAVRRDLQRRGFEVYTSETELIQALERKQ